tara:strand:+ start:736 stop:1053 length:318 start_codon:yes stop_codon:yes gene_type:complete
MDDKKIYSSLNSGGDCKNIINYLSKVLKCENIFHPTGTPRGDMYYGKNKVVTYYRQNLKIYAEVPKQRTKFVCECCDEETADFIISALRHCMPRYWDVKVGVYGN